MTQLIRGAAALLALLVGVVIGAVTTFAHAGTPPWLLLGGLAVVALFVLGVRLAIGQPLVTAGAVLGVLGAVIAFALLPGDIVIVSGDLLGTLWLLGATAVALGGALWPLPRRQGNAQESN
ncbi:MAG: hypothetical protein EAS51_07880 [Microbacteriaceae bacterium]|nr:MAG: hypothetical protein EAS51_07880 [Microbacteriaceae bacterium]